MYNDNHMVLQIMEAYECRVYPPVGKHGMLDSFCTFSLMISHAIYKPLCSSGISQLAMFHQQFFSNQYIEIQMCFYSICSYEIQIIIFCIGTYIYIYTCIDFDVFAYRYINMHVIDFITITFSCFPLFHPKTFLSTQRGHLPSPQGGPSLLTFVKRRADASRTGPKTTIGPTAEHDKTNNWLVVKIYVQYVDNLWIRLVVSTLPL